MSNPFEDRMRRWVESLTARQQRIGLATIYGIVLAAILLRMWSKS